MPREFIPGRHEPDTPSNTLIYFFREAWRRIWVSKRNSFVAIAMIAISLFILGGFLLVADNLDLAISRWQGSSRVNVYFVDAATSEQIQTVEAFLSKHAQLRNHQFVSRAEATRRFQSYFHNLAGVVDQLEANPFPPSFQIEVTPETTRSRQFGDDMTRLRRLPGVDEVQLDWEWLNRLRRLVDIINAIGLIAGGILAVAAAFTIANVIRLTMLLYREEIAIMRLVGATERIIRGPFLIEGFLQGTLGGLLSIALLYVTFFFVRRSMATPQSLLISFLFSTFLQWRQVAALVAGGMLAGSIGSWISVRERGEE